MGKNYILYDFVARNHDLIPNESVFGFFQGEIIFKDMISLDYKVFAEALTEEDEIAVCGGDETLSRFANDICGLTIKNNIHYYAIGRGNAFIYDIGKTPGAAPTFMINKYLKDLPSVSLDGREAQFINGVGFGLDAVISRGVNRRFDEKKPVDLKSIVRKAIFQYKPINITIAVDNRKYSYEKVWLAVVMNGKALWNNIQLAPDQDRLDKKKRLTIVVIHGGGRLRMLWRLRMLFKNGCLHSGPHIEMLTGHQFIVEATQPTEICKDGEVFSSITKYQAQSALSAVDRKKGS